MILIAVLFLAAIATALGFLGGPSWAWALVLLSFLFLIHAPLLILAGVGLLALVLCIPRLRRPLVTANVLKLFHAIQLFPKMSPTERAALQAGEVWMDRELFSGRPDFDLLLSQPFPRLTDEERAFLDGPVNELCAMVTDWGIWKRRDLPPEAWKFILEKGFFGMIIPKQYGGLGFSPFAHSEVVMKLVSRSNALGITCMVPNSLGPAELLIHYGTEKQKEYYLPRLAAGLEIPCFALTEPEAGSDASSIRASGLVFRGEDGAIYLKLNWNKRWITLAAISTVLGLAFQLRDPENLLGKGAEPGITCALIPKNTPGVVAERRHDPLGIPFYNCPTQGKDVIVPIDAIIGGPERAGQGWTMLMECLAAGRGISLPAESAGASKFVTQVSSAHATVRRQFNAPLGIFEGVQERLARIAGFTYLIESARLYTCGALNAGIRPPVITAIMKYQTTELARTVISDGMDVLGGLGISLGPRNLIGTHYIGTPISITVEGANILTRTLMTFGQGATRAHPYAFREIAAYEKNDVEAFDSAFWAHIGHIVRNGFRTGLLWLTRGRLARSPRGGASKSYWLKLGWASAQFAFLADLFMGSLGGKLRLKEKLTGRFADILAWMYFTAATLHRFENQGRNQDDEPLLRWALDYAFGQIQASFEGLLANSGLPGLSWLLKGPSLWLMRLNPLGRQPQDDQDFELAHLMRIPGPLRDVRLAGGIYESSVESDPFHQLQTALRQSIQADAILNRARKTLKGRIPRKLTPAELAKAALDARVITDEEFQLLIEAETLRVQVIQVDDFDAKEYGLNPG